MKRTVYTCDMQYYLASNAFYKHPRSKKRYVISILQELTFSTCKTPFINISQPLLPHLMVESYKISNLLRKGERFHSGKGRKIYCAKGYCKITTHKKDKQFVFIYFFTHFSLRNYMRKDSDTSFTKLNKIFIHTKSFLYQTFD